MGSIHEKCAIFYPEYDIHDEHDNTVFQISGPCCVCSCFTPVKFEVISDIIAYTTEKNEIIFLRRHLDLSNLCECYKRVP